MRDSSNPKSATNIDDRTTSVNRIKIKSQDLLAVSCASTLQVNIDEIITNFISSVRLSRVQSNSTKFSELDKIGDRIIKNNTY